MKRQLLLALTMTIGLAASPASALVIDGFNDATMTLQATGTTNQGVGGSVVDAIGNARKLSITNISGANSFQTAIALIDYDDSNKLSISNADGVDSTVTVIWDGTITDPFSVVSTGLNSADLTIDNDTGFLFTIPTIDLQVEMVLTVWDSDSSDSFEYEFPGPVDRFFIPFTAFAGVDFTDVGAIQLVLNGPVAWDGSVDLFQTGNPAPSPGTVLLLGAGLLALVRRRKRTVPHH